MIKNLKKFNFINLFQENITSFDELQGNIDNFISKSKKKSLENNKNNENLLSSGDVTVILEQETESKNLLKSLESLSSLLIATTANY